MAATSGWTFSSTAGNVGNDQASNNSSSITALPGGYRSQNGFFGGLDNIACFWSSTEDGSSGAWYRGLGYGSDFVIRDQLNNFRSRGFSVRCIRD